MSPSWHGEDYDMQGETFERSQEQSSRPAGVVLAGAASWTCVGHMLTSQVAYRGAVRGA